MTTQDFKNLLRRTRCPAEIIDSLQGVDANDCWRKMKRGDEMMTILSHIKARSVEYRMCGLDIVRTVLPLYQKEDAVTASILNGILAEAHRNKQAAKQIIESLTVLRKAVDGVRSYVLYALISAVGATPSTVINTLALYKESERPLMLQVFAHLIRKRIPEIA